ncbi:conserved hypothetical protein [Magnetospirillum sp. LM-5]|uniref:hypothetical protein n=1 Tax=Magnetospirillum sp. LM-5 TaxID=2681466 RepID=UPI001381A298|nr:hypothetical protein [Magnetospirillum sp. LM-5]CAA7611579.1 conserved hypothetical protein [Magnetospirillum sp. LM-5]
MSGGNFESKVADLVSVTRRLEVPQILLLRRLTLGDPETLKWANLKQLDLIFNVILDHALRRTGQAAVEAASRDHFDPLLPTGDEGARDKERWLLFDLAKPMLSGKVAEEEETTEAVMDRLDPADEDLSSLSFGDFPTLFDEAIARYLRRTLTVLAATGTRHHIPPPFIVAPGFAACFDKVVRECVLPTMRGSRRLKELANTRDWTEDGAAARLIGMAQSQDINNPIMHQWHSRWASLHPDAALKGKDGKPRPRQAHDDPWPDFQEDAAKRGYIPPYPADIPALERILLLDGEVLAAAWESLAQLYEQEFQPKSKSDYGRPGSFRDGLLAQIERLEHHGGDLLAIKAFFDFPKVDRVFIRQLIQTLGRSDIERERKAPVLIAFYNDLPK